MTEGTIALIVIAAFLVILILGFLIGLARGFNKSLVRILLLAASIVGAFFLTPVVTGAVIEMDISGFGINIGGETMSNLGEVLRSLLNQVPAIQDISGTDAFAVIMNVVPQMIVNIVMFVVLFYLIRLVTLIIYWIIAGIAFSKKKTEGKNKHRLLGSLVGVIQNFLVFVVLLIPVYGSINLVATVETIVTQETESSSSTAATTLTDEHYSVLMAEDEEETAEEDTIVTTLKKVNEVVDICKNTWVMKMLGTIKVDALCEGVFDKLSTVEKDGEKYVLKDEISNVATLYVDYKDIAEVGFDLTNEESVQAFKKLIKDCFNSKLTADLINEVIPKAIEKWNAGQNFAGIAKPTLGNYDSVLDSLFDELVIAANENKLQSKISSALDMAKSLMTAAKAMEEASDLDASTIGTLLTELTENEELMDLAKNIVVENLDTITTELFGDPEQGGDEDGYGAALNEVINTIFDGEYTEENTIAEEIAVVEKALDLVQTVGDPEKALTQDDADELMAALNNSTVIYDMLTKIEDPEDSTSANNSDVAEVVRNTIGDNAEVKGIVADAINNLTAGDDATPEELAELEARKEALAKAFGVTLS